MLLAVPMLLIGFFLLVKGADFFVDGSSLIAAKLKVPSLIIGLTIVALGTSLPELSVSVTAAINGSNSLALSNVLGSNLFNLLVVLGATSLINMLYVEDDVLKRDLPVAIICSLLVAGFAFFDQIISRTEGIILVVLLVLYLIVIIKSALSIRNSSESNDDVADASILKCILFVVGGAIAIKFGGDFVVDSATQIATFFGVSETLIGLTIVSVGTSLPELVTSLVAGKKGELSMAVGNAVGSCIFNILMILGISAAISPLSIIKDNIIDSFIFVAVSVAICLFAYSRKKIERFEGIIMLLAYSIFLVYIILR